MNETNLVSRKLEMVTKKPIHIFIVENNRIFLRMLDYIFTKDFVYRFLEFKSLEECVQNLHLNPDIIILDYALPGVDSNDTFKQIKKTNPESNLIVLVSEKDGKDPAQLITDGANDYVLKESYGVAKIIEKVENVLNTIN